jgi:GAF domain-containing protein
MTSPFRDGRPASTISWSGCTGLWVIRSWRQSDPLAQTLEDNQEAFAAGPCLQAFTSGQPAIIHDATLEPHWGEITLAFVELQVRSGLSVPVELGGGPIGTLDVYAAAPGGWDATEVSALQTYAGLVATLLGAAATAQRSGRLAEQLQVALDTRILIDRAKGALMDRERLDGQQAFVDLPRAVRSFRREPPGGAGEPATALPWRRGPTPQGRLWTVRIPWTWRPWTPKSPPSWNGRQALMGSGRS